MEVRTEAERTEDKYKAKLLQHRIEFENSFFFFNKPLLNGEKLTCLTCNCSIMVENHMITGRRSTEP